MKKALITLITVMLLGGVVWADGEMNPTGLSWDHNTESDLAGYYIYSATSSGGYTQPNFAFSVPAGTNTFDFPPSQPEGVHYWAVTAYDLAGNESGFSNEVWVVFDATPPTPPTNCSVVP